ncbi:MAG: hypothetical protein IJ711_10090 [Lachnospiraceae bacterium]|nr:hypothetical protein [Lachnospiraceae bacterium]
MQTTEELRQRAEERYQQLQFRDDFLFCKILEERPDIAQELLELILNKKEASGMMVGNMPAL